MKRILLCAVLCLASVLAWGQSGTCGENATWSFANGILTISGTGEMENYKGIGGTITTSSAPWNGYAEGSYKLQADIKTIIISKS